ncbi:hypothetical protein CIHG_05944 [Coccidioides immitis H538.4]|uniref:Uncharacterized protein n=3 Tax=Coccidioides immitis TaxID=5501 RepID=A0A0J8QVH2_COCIT|nr:hypothetical protein CIRG_01698 [Coccidioides immitis RMSCC 2394]KMU76466.1 hypothetical protein CISG_01200 [Coccidioides immitis RMSCC 3703]KMU87552.1 hypothetical protein CIHG_05944 [Coccidioides immitis H538.4]
MYGFRGWYSDYFLVLIKHEDGALSFLFLLSSLPTAFFCVFYSPAVFWVFLMISDDRMSAAYTPYTLHCFRFMVGFI